jgi:mRNA interferase RelE/StbE
LPKTRISRKLEGTDNCYRLRQGDYRLIYTVLEDRVVVLVLRVGHRGDVYRGITRAVKKHRKDTGGK